MRSKGTASLNRRGGGLLSQVLSAVAFLSLSLPGGAVRAEDPFPDLVVNNCLVANKGNRRFGEVAYGTSPQPWSICSDSMAFGDVDGDGRLDHITLQGIFLGHGDGHFGILTTAFVDPKSTVGFASADLNRDGYDDVLIAAAFGIRLYFGNSDGTLSGGEVVLSFSGGWLELVDLDGDGQEDLIGGSSVAGPLLAFGRGGGVFEKFEGVFRFPQRAAIGDFNGDGLKDLATTGRIFAPGEPNDRHTALHYYQFVEGGGLAPEVVILIESVGFEDFPVQVAAGDIDRDGNLDAVTGGGFGRLVVFPGRGDGTFDEEYTIPLPVEDVPSAVLIEDLDLDGLDDLVVGYLSIEHPAEVYWGSEGGLGFSNPTAIARSRTFYLDVMTGLRSAFVRGDADLSGGVDPADALKILGELFLGDPMICGDASDVDDSSRVNITDAVYLLSHLFRNGPAPPYPYPDRGGDLTTDSGAGLAELPGSGGDLGCSFETFHGFWPCSLDRNQEECDFPILQVIDLSPWD